MKIAIVLMTGLLLSGCEMSYQRYSDLVNRCESVGGTPLVFKTQQGVPWKVACKVSNMVFAQGSF